MDKAKFTNYFSLKSGTILFPLGFSLVGFFALLIWFITNRSEDKIVGQGHRDLNRDEKLVLIFGNLISIIIVLFFAGYVLNTAHFKTDEIIFGMYNKKLIFVLKNILLIYFLTLIILTIFISFDEIRSDVQMGIAIAIVSILAIFLVVFGIAYRGKLNDITDEAESEFVSLFKKLAKDKGEDFKKRSNLKEAVKLLCDNDANREHHKSFWNPTSN